MAPKYSVQERFLSKIKMTKTCWLWTAVLNHKGYGQFRIGKKMEQAHRVAYSLFVGPIDNLHVCHKCDIPACVNPNHLFLGTNADNKKDNVIKQRHARGERIAHSKLTSEQVLKIRQLYSEGKTQKELRKMFNLSSAHVSHIINRNRWKHL